MTLLMVEGLDVHYGKIRAVLGLDLAVEDGEIVTLVGVNGAGKSSTIRAICGVETPAAGRIEFAGQRLDRLPAHRIMALSVAHVVRSSRRHRHKPLSALPAHRRVRLLLHPRRHARAREARRGRHGL